MTATLTTKPNPQLFPSHTKGEWRNAWAFAFIKTDGSVVAFGDSRYGGSLSADSKALLNGTIDVTQIFSNYSAFAALRTDGSVISWGDTPAVSSDLNGTIDVTQIFSTMYAFAALRTDGSVIARSDYESGDTSAVASALNGSIKVTQIFSTYNAFAALRTDGSVIVWGSSSDGGDSSAVSSALNGSIDVTQIFSTAYAFAALRTDGSVIAWGDSSYGGDDSAVATALNGTIDVTQIFSNQYAFAALRTDGSVIAWGDSSYGGDSSAVASALNGSIDVTQIFSNFYAFAALRTDGSVISWGDTPAVSSDLNGTIDVTQIFSTVYAFAALRTDGSVITWGYGGGDSSAVASALNGSIDVTQIFSTELAFAALRTDGSVIAWGDSSYGGTMSATVAKQLDGTIDVKTIYTTAFGFAALRVDGSVVAWGSQGYDSNGNLVPIDTSAVATQLTSGVISGANILTDDWVRDNHAPTGTVLITGTATQNQTLTVSNTLADADGLGTIKYQWKANNIAINGATANTYKLTQAEVGKTISVTASYTDKQNTNESVNSAVTAKVVNINDTPTGSVLITGTATQNQVLTASNTLADLDGLGTIAYTWKTGTTVLGTGNKYTITANDVNKSITVTASYKDLQGTNESKTSSATSVITAPAIPDVKLNANNNFVTDEAGKTVTISVTLATQPTTGRQVSIDFATSDNTEGVINGTASLTFNSTNWNVAQKITVKGVNDYLNDGNISYTLTATINANTTDVNYRQLKINPVPLINNEDVTSTKLPVDNIAPARIPAGTPRDMPIKLYGDSIVDTNTVDPNTHLFKTTGKIDANDVLVGLDGNDTLYGGNLQDDLSGGLGNDILYGENDEDFLYGEAGNDTLDGGVTDLAADTLNGGAGNDTYFLGYGSDGKINDVIQDNGLTTDVDIVMIPFSITNYTLPTNIENGTINAGTTSSNLTGNASNNVLTGNDGNNILISLAGNDTLNGGVGNDKLNGGAGNDKLIGGAGQDSFQLIDTSKDNIADFNVADDTFQIENAVFTKFTATGVLNSAYFVIGTNPLDTNDYLIYNKTNGTLTYDADASGAGAGIQIAVLGLNLALTNNDFVVI